VWGEKLDWVRRRWKGILEKLGSKRTTEIDGTDMSPITWTVATRNAQIEAPPIPQFLREGTYEATTPA
jgi:hypothetical protein